MEMHAGDKRVQERKSERGNNHCYKQEFARGKDQRNKLSSSGNKTDT